MVCVSRHGRYRVLPGDFISMLHKSYNVNEYFSILAICVGGLPVRRDFCAVFSSENSLVHTAFLLFPQGNLRCIVHVPGTRFLYVYSIAGWSAGFVSPFAFPPDAAFSD